MTARGSRAEESGAKLLPLHWICRHEEDTCPHDVPQFPHPRLQVEAGGEQQCLTHLGLLTLNPCFGGHHALSVDLEVSDWPTGNLSTLEMSAFCADHAGEPIEGGVRQSEGAPSPRGRELPLGPNSGARILIHSFVLCDLWQIT